MKPRFFPIDHYDLILWITKRMPMDQYTRWMIFYDDWLSYVHINDYSVLQKHREYLERRDDNASYEEIGAVD